MASTHTTTEQYQSNSAYSKGDNTAVFQNVGQLERLLSALAGGGLAVYGIIRRDWTGAVLAALGGGLLFRGVMGHSFLYQALDIVTVEKSPSTIAPIPGEQGIRVRRSLTINRAAEDLYAFWRDVEQAPRYMPSIESVTRTSDRSSHWNARTPAEKVVAWNSDIIEDVPGRLISWQAHGNSLLGHAGRVTFEPAEADRGTVVTLELDLPQLRGPLGLSIGNTAAHLPEQIAQQSLRRFKALMETGEIASTQGQPTGEGRK